MKNITAFNSLFDYKTQINIDDGNYYIDMMKRSKSFKDLDKQIDLWDKYNGDFYSDRKHVVTTLMDDLAPKISKAIDSIDMEMFNSDFQEKNLIPEDNTKYVSIDIKEANWTIIKKIILKEEYPIWKEYVMSLGIEELFALSKPLRQEVLGKVSNPKKYDKIQKYITNFHIEKIKELNINYYNNIVGVNKDEIILKNDGSINIEELENIDYLLPVSFTYFTVNLVTNFEEHIRVHLITDKNGNLKYKKLFGTDGNRFFMHFKTLILGEKLEENDLITRKDKMLFKWTGKDYKKLKEYQYVEKYIKEIQWGDLVDISSKRKRIMGEINDINYRVEIVLYTNSFKCYVDRCKVNIYECSVDYLDYLSFVPVIKEEIRKLHIDYIKSFILE